MSITDELFAAAAEPARAIAEQSLAERYGDAASTLHEVMHMMKMARRKLAGVYVELPGLQNMLAAQQLMDDAIEAARKALARP